MFPINKRYDLTYREFCNNYQAGYYSMWFWTDFREAVYNWVATEVGRDILGEKTIGMIYLIGAIAAEEGFDTAFVASNCLFNLLCLSDDEG